MPGACAAECGSTSLAQIQSGLQAQLCIDCDPCLWAQILKTMALLDSDAVWLELLTVASSGFAQPLLASPDVDVLPSVKALLQGSCPPVPLPANIPRAKQAIRLLAAMPDSGAAWHACVQD